MKELSDWSGIPRDLYVTSAKSDGIVFDIQCCSVPMAIGPEVRYSLAMTKEQEDAIYAAYLGLCTLKGCQVKWGADEQVDETCDLLRLLGREFPFISQRVALSALRACE